MWPGVGSLETNKIYKFLTGIFEKKKEKTQINKITNERGEITTNTTEIQL